MWGLGPSHLPDPPLLCWKPTQEIRRVRVPINASFMSVEAKRLRVMERSINSHHVWTRPIRLTR